MPLQCKKCGGPHLTIKCGKNNNQEQNNSYLNNSPRRDSNRNNSHRNNSNGNNSNRNNFNRNKEKFCVRISNIPDDLTIRELNDLLLEWGYIGKINFNNNIKYKAAYINFYIKEEAEYFVKALHKTPFDTFIIDVELLEKNSNN